MSTKETITNKLTAKQNAIAASTLEAIRQVILQDGSDWRSMIKQIDELIDEHDDKCFEVRTENRI